MEFNKKAISPVVATALLLVVAVVAVVGFQSWFNNYQSGVQSQVQEKSNVLSSLKIEAFVGTSADGTVYVKNSDKTQDIFVNSGSISSKSGSFTCSTGSFNVLKNNVTPQTKAACNGFQTNEIVNIMLVTNDGVFKGDTIVN